MTRIEFERRRRGWTQTTLGYHARMTQSDVSRIECRRFHPTRLYLGRISHALGIPADELLDEVKEDSTTAARVGHAAP